MLRGISTHDLIGKWHHTEYLDAKGNRLMPEDRHKAVSIKQVRGRYRYETDPETGKRRRFFEEGSSEKGRKVLRKLGVVLPLQSLLVYGDRGQRAKPHRGNGEARLRKAPRAPSKRSMKKAQKGRSTQRRKR